jgi:hypothetical protein
MKVFCLNDEQWGTKVRGFFRSFIRIDPGPKYGDIDEVVEVLEYKGEKFYVLQAWPDQSYDVDEFIPISEEDETEFERQPIKMHTWPVDKALK